MLIYLYAGKNWHTNFQYNISTPVNLYDLCKLTRAANQKQSLKMEIYLLFYLVVYIRFFFIAKEINNKLQNYLWAILKGINDFKD